MRKALFFILMIAALALVLRLLNYLGSSLAEGGLRRYSSLEAAERDLGPLPSTLPSYYPETYEWPPGEILAQGEPLPLVLIHVRERDSGRISLAIREADHRISDPPPLRLAPTRVYSRQDIDLKGHPAELVFADCGENIRCLQLAWSDGENNTTLVALGSEEELLRVARSMITAK